jgi:NADPH2:quinone reductase
MVAAKGTAMKIIRADALGSIDAYGIVEAEPPSPGAGQVLVRVAACGVGYVDALVALGRYQVKPPTPYTPGQEYAGVVEAVGADVADLAPGDRVAGMAPGAFAEFLLAPAAGALKIPDAMPFVEAACLPLNYLTVLHALRGRARLAAGETVLVFGAAGGVGAAAVQVARAMGARVIAAASTEEKRAFARAQGADAAIDTAPDGWRDRLKAATGGRLDVIVDPVCGPLFEPAFRSLSWGGRHLVIGFLGGPIPALPSNLTLMKGAALVGVDVRQYLLFERDRAMADLRELVGWAAAGRIRPPVGPTFPFADFGPALEAAIAGQGGGKVVLVVDAP